MASIFRFLIIAIVIGAVFAGSCQVGQLWDVESSSCVSSCKSYQYSSGLASAGEAKCINCSNDIPSCNQCSLPSDLSQLQCLSCSDNKYLKADKNDACISECPVGYAKDDSPATCKTCSFYMPNCLECSGKTTCTKCSSPFLLFNNQCASKTCPTGYYSNAEKCDKCDESCYECSNSGKNSCTKCKSGNYLNPDGSCKLDCIPGTFPDTLTLMCKKCEGMCENCATSPINCLSCISPYNYNSQTKTCHNPGQCPDGTYEENGFCKICGSNCKTCSGTPNFCTSCSQAEPFLIKNVCLSCPASVQNCNKCDANGRCISCQTGLFLNDGTCQSTCPKGTYSDSRSMTCVSCSLTLTNCAACSSSNVCSECKGGYYNILPTNTTCDVCSKSDQIRIREGGCINYSVRPVLSAVKPDAEITVSCSVEGELYYILRKNPTTISAIEMQKLVRTTSFNQTFGSAKLLKSSNFNVKNVFSSLEIDNLYYFTAYCVNSFGVLSERPITTSFSFADNQAKDLVLNIQLTNVLTFSQKRTLACDVADLLSINQNRVTTEDGSNCRTPTGSSNGRLLEDNSSTRLEPSFSLLLFIAKDLKQLDNNEYLTIKETINSKQFSESIQTKLNGTKIVSLNSSDINKKQSVIPVPVLYKDPVYNNRTVKVEIQVTNAPGLIFIAIDEEGFNPQSPSAQQLRKGVNFLDTPFISYKSDVADKDEIISFEFTDLKRLFNYTIFYAAASMDIPSNQVIGSVQIKNFRALENYVVDESEKGYTMEERRNIAIGIGVGVGGFILIISLICALLVTKTKSQDKYELASDKGGSNQAIPT